MHELLTKKMAKPKPDSCIYFIINECSLIRNYLYSAIRVQQYVFCFQIAMDHFILYQICQKQKEN